MRLGGRLAAAIDVLEDISRRHRPAADALKDWGLSHRFAGAGDRAAIGNIVYDALRRKRSAGWLLGADTPRALGFGALLLEWNQTPQSLNDALQDDKFAPPPLDADELQSAVTRRLDDAPPEIRADCPDWCAPLLEAAFGEDWVAEGAALATRPPLDLRVNTLKANRDRILTELSGVGAAATRLALARHPHSADRRLRPPPQRPGRARLPERLVRGPGRRFADRRRTRRRRSRHAGAGLLRRRRRQDPGAVGSHGKPRPDIRL